MKKFSVARQIWRAVYIPLIYVGTQFFVSFAASFIAGIMYGFKMAGSGNTEFNTEELTRFTQSFLTENMLLIVFISLIISFTIFFLIWNKEKKYIETPGKITPISAIILIILGILSSLTIGAFIVMTNMTKLFPSYEQIEQAIISGSLPLRIITIALLGPITEELAFRGIVFNRLRNNMPFLPSALISSFIFGFIHLNILQGIYAGLLGVLLAFLYEKCRTIWVPIIVHIAFNSPSIIETLLSAENAESSGTNIESIIIFAVGAAAILFIIRIWLKILKTARR